MQGRKAADHSELRDACEGNGTNMDKEFNPSVDMMVNDFDDERTLDEEEALEGSEDPQTELSNLQKEGDMPLEELLAMYGYGDPNAETTPSSSSSSSNEPLSSQEIAPEKEEEPEVFPDREELKSEPSHLHKLYTELPSSPKIREPHSSCRLLRFSRQPSDEDEEDDDYDYTPEDDDEWKKTIMVGNDYQAVIPDGLCKYDDALPYENDDKLLWDPKSLEETEFEKFLVKAQEPLVNNSQGMSYVPSSTPVRDDEQALYLLLQCGYNVEEALRRRRMNVVPPTDTMSLWSEDECRNFENGLRTYGKDFHMIQQNKVRTRSVGELVQFYYLWKKTERHDIFANKSRLEKKKYTLHPGVTDYMDRFLDEQESAGCPRDGRSSSPNVHSLISGDPKRQQRVQESMADALNHMASASNALEPGKMVDVDVKDSGKGESDISGGESAASAINSGASVSTSGEEGRVKCRVESRFMKGMTLSSRRERVRKLSAAIATISPPKRSGGAQEGKVEMSSSQSKAL
ncbi:mesoderm induction early response protein 1-like isoform X2 [Ischnura elegans]|uniref:mesoderm induction early response protein 1-like isoform X2 n=1 Tax=Ischnura elegans TaxID=197161 RepID=UPI001ED88CCC|nr:mesoderm induction early response protein 1-like isoform X2 [Ischnura elegans]